MKPICNLKSAISNSRQPFPACRFHQPIPFVARELELVCLRSITNVLGLRAADDGNNLRRMFQQPRQRYDSARHTVIARDVIERLAQSDAARMLRAVDVDGQRVGKSSARERAP